MSKPSIVLGLFVTMSGGWDENVSLDYAMSAMDDIAANTEDLGVVVWFQDFDGTDLAFWRPNPT